MTSRDLLFFVLGINVGVFVGALGGLYWLLRGMFS